MVPSLGIIYLAKLFLNNKFDFINYMHYQNSIFLCQTKEGFEF